MFVRQFLRPHAAAIAAMLLPVAPFLCADSGKFNGIYFETKGTGNVVVLLHGGQMDRRMWDAQFDLFARRHCVIRYDIRGFGQSETPTAPYSDAADLGALLQHLEVRHASLVGLSLGAAVAVDFALTHTNMSDALVLVCPGLGGFHFTDKANDLRAVLKAAQENNFDKVADLWLANPYMSVAMEKPALHKQLRQLARDNSRCWLNNPLLLRRLTPSADERFSEIRVPTLVIGGERDVSDIHKIVEKLAAEIPGAKKKILPGAGHLVPMELPDEFNRIALEFIEQTHQK
jgi:pimeloyl-ACP methyl ester carboxylesterase